MPMPQDPDTDDVVWCDLCGEVKRRVTYRLIHGGKSAVWICERCEGELGDDEPEEV